MTVTSGNVYYDPYDVGIDADGNLDIDLSAEHLPDGGRRLAGTASSRDAPGPCLQASTGRSR